MAGIGILNSANGLTMNGRGGQQLCMALACVSGWTECLVYLATIHNGVGAAHESEVQSNNEAKSLFTIKSILPSGVNVAM